MHSIGASLVGKVSRSASPKTIPLCGCSADDTNKESRVKIRPRPGITMPPKSKSPSHHQPTSPASSYMLAIQSLDPRPLQDLHNERSYLFYNLRKQGDRATRLFQRYAAVETRLAAATTTPETRKCKKEAALIKTKIVESTQQEQLILLRLGEIHVELQNRDRWMLVHHRPLLQSPPPLVYPTQSPPPYPLSPSVAQGGEVYPLSPFQEHEREQEDASATDQSSDYFSCPPSSLLSPLSPCFTPGVVFSEDIWSRASKTSAEKETTTTEDGSAPTFTPTESADEVGSQAGCGQRRDSRRHGAEGGVGHQEEQGQCPEATTSHDEHVGMEEDYCCEQRPTPPSIAYGACVDGTTNSEGWDAAPDSDRDEEEDSQDWKRKLRRVSLYLPLPLSHKVAKDKERKRMSLPYLKGMWPQSRRNSIQSATAG